ncbi:hypothetical protein BCS96_06575 [Vibrio breoganii]|uniref:hypothetical protein n=1 Tax=Vibrio breoganii TaxID=553239 RepID=UPI000C8412BE|nr:hypothetical protein [Vibrio breoganii]PMG35305.1 hypothetical protein BCU93_17650 [Vibrio breoganii]PMG90790.1 hypothetical protein BCU81_05370 [Vibrio breoganii]PMH22239.1 hypothetical protein BCU74_03895 [Vibrio breoganii]PML80801.1 hypothetical protein BCT68_14740 [Vibrio breoganii]PMP00606.1 hypothetical protein BCS96_06575 [Vibrio breoganii]
MNQKIDEIQVKLLNQYREKIGFSALPEITEKNEFGHLVSSAPSFEKLIEITAEDIAGLIESQLFEGIEAPLREEAKKAETKHEQRLKEAEKTIEALTATLEKMTDESI